MDIETEIQDIEKYSTILVVSSAEKLQLAVNTIIKLFSRKKLVGVYVCLNRPYKAAKTLLEKEKIRLDKVFFIDCITSHIGQPDKSEGVLHICSPAELTGLTTAISSFIKTVEGKKYIFLDALTTLLIYNKEDVVLAFMKSLLGFATESNTQLIVLTPEISRGEFSSKIIPLFNKVVHIT